MYESLKKIVKKVLPNKLLQSNQSKFRSLAALLYLGTKYKCNLCNYNLRVFPLTKAGDKICPSCGSLPRTRLLYDVISNNLDHKNILHFSPSNSMRKKLSEAHSPRLYLTTDFENEFIAQKKLNIEKLDLEDNSFDLIICFHILEHVNDDHKAIQELFRVTKPGGINYLQTPFKNGEIYENSTIKSKAERLIHFGQEDHVRIYSKEGLKTRLERAGFAVEILNFKFTEGHPLGFKDGAILKATKK